MARHTLSYAMARLRAGQGHMVVSPDDAGDRAMLLMCFLRYVEDNAEDLGIRFSDQERLESILPAYGTAFFTQAHLVSHVVAIATKLGMDSRAFRKYVESLATKDIKENASYFDLEPGTLKNAESNGASSLIDELFFDRGRHRVITPTAMASMIGTLAKQLYTSSVEHVPAGDTIRIFDPFCFEGTVLVQTWGIFSKAFEEAMFVLGGSDADGTCVATASMRLFMNGYRGDYSNIRIDENAQGAPASGLYDIVVTDPGPTDWERDSLSILEERAQGVCDPLKNGGVGIFMTPLRALGGYSDSEERRRLLARCERGRYNILSSCIEFPDHAFPTSANVLWVISTPDDPDTSDVFLASLDGDGLAKAKPDFYENLFGTPEECAGSLDWFVDFVAEQKCFPFLSAKIPVKRILERRDVSLRFSTYETTIDMGSRVQEIASLQIAWSHYQEVIGRMGHANDSFYKALDAIVHRRSEGNTAAE